MEVRPGRGGGLFVVPISPVVRLRCTVLTVVQGQSGVNDASTVREAVEELIALDSARHRTGKDISELHPCMAAM